MTKIAAISSSRADYGIMANLLKGLAYSVGISLELIVTGAHISSEHGMTIDEILEDGFSVSATVPFDLDSDSPINITIASGHFTNDLAICLNQMKPDAIIILGDRFEMLPAAYVAAMLGIKIIHIHGGEITLGAIDNKIRFAISHLADFHLTATHQSSQRLIACGIRPECIVMTGALGVENILNITKVSRKEIKAKTGVQFCEMNILFTFHSETLSMLPVQDQIRITLNALAKFDHIGKFISLPNADTGNSIIRQELENFGKNHPNVFLTQNLGRVIYLSLMSEVNAVIGNSSSGIIEAPALSIPTVNIGDRQKGREQAPSIIQCGFDASLIKESINIALSNHIEVKLSEHPYYLDNTCNIMLSAIRKFISC